MIECLVFFFFFKQKTAYEMRISDWSSDVCSSDLNTRLHKVVESGAAEIGQVQEMRDVTRVVNRVPVLRDGQVIGAIGRVAFKAPEEVHELSRQISSLRAEVDYYKKEQIGRAHV